MSNGQKNSFSYTFFIQGKNQMAKKNCLGIHHRYLKEAFHLTQNTVGFTAAISGTAYGYFTVGMYETTLGLLHAGRAPSRDI